MSIFFFVPSQKSVDAQTAISTTTLTISICGDSLVNAGEDCDVPADTGQYSTSIAGRECTSTCVWAPYCGDGVLQTVYGEECDDGNNISLDFCAADCTTEISDAGGGSTGGGGSSGSGGRDTPLGDTEITVQGRAYPNATVSILLDGSSVGTVRSNSSGNFLFNTEAEPGTASMSFYANDNQGTRSATFNTTFDVTQGAVTNINGVFIPPTIRANATEVNPGDIIVLSGQAAPSVDIEVAIDNENIILTAVSDNLGNWSVNFDTSSVSVAEHTAKARFLSGSGNLKSKSIYGTVLQLFVGVEGRATSNSDLNRDGLINLIDFSILIFWWGTPGGNSNPAADINLNGNVGLEDFSILLFNWTG